VFEHLDPDARRIFEPAQHEARDLRNDYISTEHLLVALAIHLCGRHAGRAHVSLRPAALLPTATKIDRRSPPCRARRATDEVAPSRCSVVIAAVGGPTRPADPRPNVTGPSWPPEPSGSADRGVGQHRVQGAPGRRAARLGRHSRPRSRASASRCPSHHVTTHTPSDRGPRRASVRWCGRTRSER
jgi:hypothetical protein